jgi:anti-sigma B factor antagonist
MARKIEISGEVFQFSVEGEVTSCMVGELREAIFPAITHDQEIETEIEIDLSRVSEIDFAGLLLMLEIKLTASARGKALRFIGHSKPVTEIMKLSGLADFFGASHFYRE